jgi:hypothetical protein
LFGQHLRNIHDYSDYKLFRVESRVDPSNPNALAPAPGGGPPPSFVTLQPMRHTDPWYPIMLIMYRKSQSSGELIRQSDQKWLGSLGFTSQQLNTIHEVTQRLEEELQEIDAKEKAIFDAQRAAHPLPPELKALHQKYQAQMEQEVANFKSALGPDLTARLNIFIQAQEARAATHHPGSTPGATRDSRMHSLREYDAFFMLVNSYDEDAINREELDDEDGTHDRNLVRDNLGFTDEQFEPIRATAQRWKAEKKEYFNKLVEILDPYSANIPPVPELAALNQQQEATIDTEIAYLRRTLGPDVCAKLDAYFRAHYDL